MYESTIYFQRFYFITERLYIFYVNTYDRLIHHFYIFSGIGKIIYIKWSTFISISPYVMQVYFREGLGTYFKYVKIPTLHLDKYFKNALF